MLLLRRKWIYFCYADIFPRPCLARFLVSSNPLKAVEIDKNEIIAHSTDGINFQLVLDNPNSIRILD